MDGKRLKELRINKKLTQEELGRKIHVSKVSISGYESGNRTPDTETLQRIADYFGVTTDYLLGRTEHPNFTTDMTLDEKVKELMKILEEMPAEKREIMEERILAYAKGLADANED